MKTNTHYCLGFLTAATFILSGQGICFAQFDVYQNNILLNKWEAKGSPEWSNGTGNLPSRDGLYVDIGGTFKTHLYRNGIIEEDNAFIFVPHVDMRYGLLKYGNDEIIRARFSWNAWVTDGDNIGSRSFEDGALPVTNFYGGAWANLGRYDFGDLELDLGVNHTVTPDLTFDEITSLQLRVVLDDESKPGILGCGFGGDGASSNPYLYVEQELDGSLVGQDEGLFYEFGAHPYFPCYGVEAFDLAFAFPFSIGMGDSEYYDDGSIDDNCGFFRMGARVHFDGLQRLLDLPGEMGAYIGIDYLKLGDVGKSRNNDDDDEWVGRFNFHYTF